MNRHHMTGMLVGGFLPAILYGIGGIFQKLSIQSGIGIGPYIVGSGVGALIAGSLIWLILPENPPINVSGVGYAMVIGFIWALGMTSVAVALQRYSAPLAKLAPIYNMNTLITVLLALIIFSEWQELSISRLLGGTLLIILGCSLVAGS